MSEYPPDQYYFPTTKEFPRRWCPNCNRYRAFTEDGKRCLTCGARRPDPFNPQTPEEKPKERKWLKYMLWSALVMSIYSFSMGLLAIKEGIPILSFPFFLSSSFCTYYYLKMKPYSQS